MEEGIAIYPDCHAHLSLGAERPGGASLEEVLGAYGRAYAANPGHVLILDPGVSPEDYEGREASFLGYPFIALAAGAYPGEGLFSRMPEAFERLAALASRPSCKAVGECGLDYHWMEAEPAVQRTAFERAIGIAASAGKGLIVHSRDAAEDTLAVIASARAGGFAEGIQIHCYSYGRKEAEAFLELGCYLSFAGNLTFSSASALREALAIVPADRLLIETDSPYMAPVPRRGRASSPLDIRYSYEAAARSRGVDPAALASAVGHNLGAFLGV